jgi:hypothetical protein
LSNGFHCLRAWVCDPEVSKLVAWPSCKEQNDKHEEIRMAAKLETAKLHELPITRIRCHETFIRLLREHSMSHISADFCSAMWSQNFLKKRDIIGGEKKSVAGKTSRIWYSLGREKEHRHYCNIINTQSFSALPSIIYQHNSMINYMSKGGTPSLPTKVQKEYGILWDTSLTTEDTNISFSLFQNS